MSALDRVREKFKVPMSGASKASKSPSAGSAGASPAHIHSSEGDPIAGLTPIQESARRWVLGQLQGYPNIQRAFCNRFEDGALIVTLAIRDVGTCELLVPAESFDRSKLSDFTSLLECLTGVPA
jgi:hypothetical protein